MATNRRITYKIIEGTPDQETIDAIVAVTKKIFGSLKMRKTVFVDVLASRKRLVICLAYVNHKLVGFKVGYEKGYQLYYSQLGGVLPAYRGRGIASRLMAMQHKWCEESGYRAIRTETQNKWREMLLLNIRHGFNVVGTHTDDRGFAKIILERPLN